MASMSPVAHNRNVTPTQQSVDLFLSENDWLFMTEEQIRALSLDNQGYSPRDDLQGWRVRVGTPAVVTPVDPTDTNVEVGFLVKKVACQRFAPISPPR